PAFRTAYPSCSRIRAQLRSSSSSSSTMRIVSGDPANSDAAIIPGYQGYTLAIANVRVPKDRPATPGAATGVRFVLVGRCASAPGACGAPGALGVDPGR